MVGCSSVCSKPIHHCMCQRYKTDSSFYRHSGALGWHSVVPVSEGSSIALHCREVYVTVHYLTTTAESYMRVSKAMMNLYKLYLIMGRGYVGSRWVSLPKSSCTTLGGKITVILVCRGNSENKEGKKKGPSQLRGVAVKFEEGVLNITSPSQWKCDNGDPAKSCRADDRGSR
ncbi:hypothetical protein EDB85DRAFT_1970433 [Lactarius pseudohatsudake]|nr:hypothetical protein EDB85DRAFT_1970433 [Lactarius pseudohatsudake]